MNGASQIEIEAMVLSSAIVVMPALVAVIYLLLQHGIWRRRRPRVSFLEVIRR